MTGDSWLVTYSVFSLELLRAKFCASVIIIIEGQAFWMDKFWVQNSTAGNSWQF